MSTWYLITLWSYCGALWCIGWTWCGYRGLVFKIDPKIIIILMHTPWLSCLTVVHRHPCHPCHPFCLLSAMCSRLEMWLYCDGCIHTITSQCLMSHIIALWAHSVYIASTLWMHLKKKNLQFTMIQSVALVNSVENHFPNINTFSQCAWWQSCFLPVGIGPSFWWQVPAKTLPENFDQAVILQCLDIF